jgi:hypothetical protein
VLGISENIARRHYAKWSAARQERISTIMRLVHDGEVTAGVTLQLQELLTNGSFMLRRIAILALYRCRNGSG